MWTLLAVCVVMMCSTLAQGAPPTRAVINPRVSLTGYGALAWLPAPPTPTARTEPMLAGCGGGGVIAVPEREVRRRRGAWPEWQALPSHRRIVVRALDACGWTGSSQAVLLAPVQVGYGGQWGGRRMYVAAQVEGGLGNFHRDRGVASVNDFGLTAKPRLALGLQLGPVGVEVGPTARALVPLQRTVRNSFVSDGVFAAGSLDVEVTLGAGVGPVRWWR